MICATHTHTHIHRNTQLLTHKNKLDLRITGAKDQLRKKEPRQLAEELPASCNLLLRRKRRSQGEGNTRQGGSRREQRPFTLTHNTHIPTCKHSVITLRCTVDVLPPDAGRERSIETEEILG